MQSQHGSPFAIVSGQRHLTTAPDGRLSAVVHAFVRCGACDTAQIVWPKKLIVIALAPRAAQLYPMDIEIIWVSFVLTAGALALIALPVFRFVDAAPQVSSRYATIDGLRGFLAFSVFIFHVVVTRRYFTTGVWQPPNTSFFALLGPFGVSVFFMITGFLFWTKLLQSRGRVNWKHLYLGRLLRIGPMYLVTVLCMLMVVFAKTGFALRQPLGEVFASILQWLMLGIFNLQPDVNGYPATHVLAGVTWTISYEWFFYASLIVTAYFARGRRHLYFVGAALLFCFAGKFLTHSDALGLTALFLLGMMSASLLHEGIEPRLSDRVASLIAALCVIALFVLSSLGYVRGGYSTPAALLLAGFFYLICSGTTLFGLLLTRAARRLGHISYSIYLLQGLALTLVFALPAVWAFALKNVASYWLSAALCAATLLSVSALTYFFIELPAMRFGHARRKKSALAAASPTGLAAEKQLIAP